MSRGAGVGRGTLSEMGAVTGTTPGGTRYWYFPGDPDFGWLIDSQLAQKFPMSYIYGLAAHTPSGSSTWVNVAPVEVQAAALGGSIAVIYGQDRVAADIFFGPWVTPDQSVIYAGFGLGEGEIDSLVTVETAAGVPITNALTSVPAALSATGLQTVTPFSMTGIAVGKALAVGNPDNTNREVVVVTAVTGSTFTAVFSSTKSTGWTVRGDPGASFVGYGGLGTLHFYRGVDAPSATDSLFTAITALNGQTFDERYPGLAHVAASFTFNADALNNFPDLRWTVRGRKVLDPRLGVDGNGLPNQPAVWSDNPMLCLADYFTNPYYGRGTPLSEINWASVGTIATWCDAIQSDGRKRFTFNATLRTEASHKANIDFIRSHFRCTYARVQGQFKFYVDQPRAVVEVFDEVDHAITYATNASPIVITAPGHLRETGDSVSIAGVNGNTATNGRWVVTKIDADTLSLTGSTGNGAYIDGGAILGNCRALHRWRTPTDQIPTKVEYKWTDPSRDYQTATAPDILPAAQAGLVYVRPAVYNGDGCNNAGQGQSQATYLRLKRSKDLNHSIVCSRARGLAMEIYDACRLNLPSFGLSGYYADITRLTKFESGEFQIDFEEYDSAILGEVIVGTQSKPAITAPNPSAVPPTPSAPVLTQDGTNIKIDFSPPSPPYPYYAGTRIIAQQDGFSSFKLGQETSGPLYLEDAMIGARYVFTAFVISLLGVSSSASASSSLIVTGDPLAPTILSQPVNVVAGTTGTATLSVSAIPSGPGITLRYQWYAGESGNLSAPVGTNASSYLASPAYTQKYWVQITDSQNRVTDSASATVFVTLIISQPRDVVVALGATATLSVQALAQPGIVLSYQWYQGASGVTTTPVGTNAPTLSIAPTATVSYWVRVYVSATAWHEDSAAAVVSVQSTTSASVALGRMSASIVEEIPVDNDTSLTADSSTKMSTQHAIKTYVDDAATRTQTLTNKTLTAPAITAANVTDGDLELAGQRIQVFQVQLFNNSGTLQARFISDASAPAAWAVSKVNGATATLTNLVTVSSVVAFTNGIGIDTANTNTLLLDVADQGSASNLIIAPPTVSRNTTGAAPPMVEPRIYSQNVNSVTRLRLALQLFDATTGAAWTINTTNIPSTKVISINVMAWLK